MKNWINEQKRETCNLINTVTRPRIDISHFKVAQEFAYSILEKHVNDPNAKQLLMRVEGVAGTGKSHLLNACCNLLDDYAPNVKDFYIVAAPTGRAAYNVLGTTMHSAFILGLKDKDFKDLANESLRNFQEKLKNCMYIFIEEFGMVGQSMLGKLDKRLRSAKCNNLPFGGMNIIMFGDRKQLPPVLDNPLWSNKITTNTIARAGKALWTLFDTVVELTENVRQNDPSQEAFRQLLGRLRNGQCLGSDYHILEPRLTGNALDADRFKNSMYLMYENSEVDDMNQEELLNLYNREINPQRSIRIDAHHNNPAAATIASDLMMGLQSSIILARDARVMITANLWTERGITNGTTGTIRHIIYTEGACPPSLPLAVIVELDEGYTGPCLQNQPRYVVINPVTRGINSPTGRLERTMLPLRLAFAITIHKCQGKIYNFLQMQIYNIN